MAMVTDKAVLGAACAVWVMAASTAAAVPADFKAHADALLESSFPADGPGAAVVVVDDGEVVYSGGRGLADLETKRAITPDTPFKLGSIVKQFTAATVLKLAADGKLSLDDPVSRFFPDWPQPGAGATVRQLLNHSSGIQDYSKIPGWISRNRGRSWTTAELLGVMRDLPAKSKPGEAREYKNGGYVLLGAIVEKVTGRAWHEAIAEGVTGPLGLKTVAFAGSEAAMRTMARGYSEANGRAVPVPVADMSVAHAAGGLVGSVADLGRWAQALHHGKVVGAALYKEMTSPAMLADGSTRPYGFGFRLQQLRGRPVLVHGGAGAGLDADSAYVPSEDLYVAVLANSDEPATDSSILTRRLAALALGEPIPTFTRAEVPLASIEPLFGAYRRDGGPAFHFFERGGKLFLSSGDNQMEAFAAGGDRFFFGPDRLLWIKFDRKADGAHVLEVHEADSAGPERAVRSGPVPAPRTVAPELLRAYSGTYKTPTAEVTIAIDPNGQLTIQPAGGQPMAMRPVSDSEFRVDAGGFRVVFHREGGAVDRFTMYRGAREMEGRRIAP